MYLSNHSQITIIKMENCSLDREGSNECKPHTRDQIMDQPDVTIGNTDYHISIGTPFRQPTNNIELEFTKNTYLNGTTYYDHMP
jgi:hypothetical protein